MVRAQMEITKCPFGYLFLTEIELLSAECGFENLEAVEWLISNRWQPSVLNGSPGKACMNAAGRAMLRRGFVPTQNEIKEKVL